MPSSKRGQLTEREEGLIRLIAAGLHNKAIAERLVLSPYTVRDEISSLLHKLGLESRVELVRWWYERREDSGRRKAS